jgi:hypothetical protein
MARPITQPSAITHHTLAPAPPRFAFLDFRTMTDDKK